MAPAAPEPASGGAAKDARRRRRRRLVTQESVGAAAFLLGLSLAGVNAFQAMRGADIVALPPEDLYLYRDAGPGFAALSMAVRVPLVNRASADYGDVVRSVSARLAPAGEGAGPTFAHQTTVEPIFTDRDPRTLAASCDVRVRCVAAQGFIAIERSRTLVDLPGGAARDQHFGFNLDREYCAGPGRSCAAFTDFDHVVTELARRPLTVSIDVRFTGERHRGVRCAIHLTPQRAAYLRARGWVTLPCLPSSA